MFPGSIEIAEYVMKRDASFEGFLESYTENMAVWSSSLSTNSPSNLYSVWKKRFIQSWNSSRNDRPDRIKYDQEIWTFLYEETKGIISCRNSFKLQGLSVLNEVSNVVGGKLIQSLTTSHSPSTSQRTDKENTKMNSSEADLPQQLSEDGRRNNELGIAIPAIKIPAPANRFILNGVDISVLFYAFQAAAAISVGNQFFLESHVHHILSLFSIFLVQKERFHPDIIALFDRHVVNDVVDHMHQMFSVGAHGKEFPLEPMKQVSKVVKDIKHGRIQRRDAVIDLHILCRSLSLAEAKVVGVIAKLIEKLPKENFKDAVQEAEHCARFVDPILSGLFDDPENDVFFRWTSVINGEAKNDNTLTAARPDSLITSMDGLYFGMSLGFAEMKPTTNTSTYFAAKDLVRLGVFSKNSIDQNNLKGCLTIQVVGFKMTFFLTTLLADGLYAMVELCTLTIPASLNDLSQFLACDDDLLSVVNCFHAWCSPLPEPLPTAHKRKSLDDSAFSEIVSPTRSMKRRAYTSH
ncbi:hypothetical protein DM01DRAFT_1323768 [Hesseltinella vesiculosa]|uniref:Uncharacterized protein n=1 Tax=Hesseltinella vesiculosa TaxID=101127 RepID=A0A1X2GEE7_9FUNG|nr:hypothetical protein DM01DRAFT_1323768 [Hesseltinella vesiculosa]